MKPTELNLYDLSGKTRLGNADKKDSFAPWLLLIVIGGPIVQYFSGLAYHEPISLFLLAPVVLLIGLSVILLISCLVAYGWSRWLKSTG